MTVECDNPPRCGLAAHVHLHTPALVQICGDGSPRLFVRTTGGSREISMFVDDWHAMETVGGHVTTLRNVTAGNVRDALIWLATGVWP